MGGRALGGAVEEARREQEAEQEEEQEMALFVTLALFRCVWVRASDCAAEGSCHFGVVWFCVGMCL